MMNSRQTMNVWDLGLAAVVTILLVAFVPVPVRAQVAGATLSGTITDSAGAVVVNATVVVKNLATGIAREVNSDTAGFFSAPNLPAGNYEVTASAPGFSTKVQTGIALTVGQTQLLDISLKVGGNEQTIEVQGEAPSVDLVTSMLSAEVSSETMRELPLNGRDWAQLAMLQPGIVQVNTQTSSNTIGGRGNRGFGNMLSDVGHSPYMNNYRINGISANDYTNGAPGSVLGGQLGVDGIEEFSVQSTNYPAEYGRTAGAVINAITRSGTNEFHGTAYWFLRDDKLDARNFFDPPQIAPFHRNQFGAAGGGPIKKGKTFLFVNYEGIRQDLGLTFHNTVPSAAARAGNLCSVPSGSSCTPSTITVDPLVAPFLNLWPSLNAGLVPSGNGDLGFFNTTASSPTVENYFTVRIDQQFSTKDSLSGSYTYDKSTQTQPDALLLSTTSNLSQRQLFTFEWSHVISPSLVNSFRMGYNRPQELLSSPVTALDPLAKDVSLAALPGKYAPILQVPGLTAMQGSFGALPISAQVMNSIQAYDDLFLTKGKHSLKFGFAYENMRSNIEIVIRQNGGFGFPSLQGFLQNEPTYVTLLDLSQLEEVGGRQNLFGAYAQDDWRVMSNLTLNFGLRYEPTTLPKDEHNRFQVIKDIYGGPVVPVNTLWASNATLTDFAPRVGFSWDPLKKGTTAVRGGFGIYNNLPLPWTWTVPNAASYPFSLFVVAGGLPAGSFPTGAASLVPFDIQHAAVLWTDQNPKRSYAMNWNLNVQQQIVPSLTATVSYVGSHSVHGYQKTDDQNMVLPTLTSAGYLWPYPVGSGTRVNSLVGSAVGLTADVAGSYEGLVAGLVKKFSHGFQAQGSFAHSKCNDTGTLGPSTGSFNNSVQNPMFFNRDNRDGACDFDVRNSFVGNYLWQLPKRGFGGAFGEMVLGGWSLGGVTTVSSGTPFSVYIGGDSLGQLSSGPNNFPDRAASPGCANPINPGNPNNYLKLNCFTPPIAPASFAAVCQPAAPSVAAVIPNTCMNLFGKNGRNTIYGPGLVNWDFSLTKDSYIKKISESFDVQFRAEFFNIFNRANFQSPLDNSTVLNQNGTQTPGAGIIDATTTTSRQIQLGLKVIW
jgi:hypothetical protein